MDSRFSTVMRSSTPAVETQFEMELDSGSSWTIGGAEWGGTPEPELPSAPLTQSQTLLRDAQVGLSNSVSMQRYRDAAQTLEAAWSRKDEEGHYEAGSTLFNWIYQGVLDENLELYINGAPNQDKCAEKARLWAERVGFNQHRQLYQSVQS